MQIRSIGSLTTLAGSHSYSLEAVLSSLVPGQTLPPVAVRTDSLHTCNYVDVCHKTYYFPPFFSSVENGNDGAKAAMAWCSPLPLLCYKVPGSLYDVL
jgi:hypothetical protein